MAAAAWSWVEKMLHEGPAHLRAERAQRLDQHRGLDRHVQRARDARALQRPLAAVLLAQGHEPRHLGLGDGDLGAAVVGLRDVADHEVLHGGALLRRSRGRPSRGRPQRQRGTRGGRPGGARAPAPASIGERAATVAARPGAVRAPGTLPAPPLRRAVAVPARGRASAPRAAAGRPPAARGRRMRAGHVVARAGAVRYPARRRPITGNGAHHGGSPGRAAHRPSRGHPQERDLRHPGGAARRAAGPPRAGASAIRGSPGAARGT